jgi:hypothetical protein
MSMSSKWSLPFRLSNRNILISTICATNLLLEYHFIINTRGASIISALFFVHLGGCDLELRHN